MYCENCGKSLIRGYQFCLECGTPVPPQPAEEDEQPVAAEAQQEGMPQVEPMSSEGSLVFCPNCGMHMQQSTAYCEKCGERLQANSADGGNYSNLPKNGEVPLWNTERVDYGYENMTDGDIEQINNFINGGGIAAPDYEASGDYDPLGVSGYDALGGGGMDAVGSASADNSAAEIESITAQLASICPSGSEMPAIGAKDNVIHDEVVKVENFAMDSSYVDSDYVDTGALPVIEGASMEYDPDEPEPEDPNAFVMTPEAIEDITPQYVPETVEEDTPVYEEPVAAAPAYEEPVAEGVPVYEEPVAAAPVYEEPVAAAPVYEEPVAAAPVYEEPVAEEVPVYEEPVAEEPAAYEESAAIPAYTIPVFGEDDTADNAGEAVYNGYDETSSFSSDIPLYSDPNAESEAAVPAYEDPVIPTYEDAVPAYEDNSVPSYEEQADPEATIGFAAAGVAAASYDSTPAYSSYDANSNASAYGYSAPVPESVAPAAAPVAEAEPEVDLGKLVYCRTCGQDMYEKELVCRNCGAPKRPEYVPPSVKQQRKKKEPFKLFGIFSIPALVGVGAALVVLALIIAPSVFSNTNKPPVSGNTSNSSVSGNEQLNAGANTTSSATTASDEDKPVESDPDDTVSTPEQTEPIVPPVTETTEPVAPETEETPGPDVPPVSSTPESSSTPASSTTPNTTPKPPVSSSTTPKPPASSSTPKPPVSSTTPKTSVSTPQQSTTHTPSATVVNQDKQRDKLIDAFETLSAEVGKVDLLARSTITAIMFDSRSADAAGKSFYTRDVAASMLKNIKSGKSSVASAISSAKPSASELKTAYNALCSLQDKYLAYYDYVVNATSFGNYESKCDSYLNAYNNAVKTSFALSRMETSAQTTADKNAYYAYVLGEAVTAVENAASAYSTLRTKIASLSESNFSSKFNDKLNDNINTYLKAAKYTQAAASYCSILASAPAAYSGAYNNLKTACSNLSETFDVFCLAQYDNTLANFKSTVNSYVNAATSAASKAKGAL